MKKRSIFIGALVVLCSIALAAPAGALSEKDWRKQVDWRATTPSLVNWLTAFRAVCPAFDATAASAS